MKLLQNVTLDRILELNSCNLPVRNLPMDRDGHSPFMIVPAGCKAEDLSAFYPMPRILQRVELQDAGSFIAYVNRFKSEETLIFAQLKPNTARFFAALDYHTKAPELVPAYIQHRAVYETQQTPEFTTWLAANRKAMTQVEFATFLEDNSKLFIEPAGADLLEMVQSLFGKQDVRFSSAVRLQSGGNRLHFDEDVVLNGTNSTRGGDVELPKTLRALLPVFQGSASYVVEARLKYRIESRKLTLWFETIGLHEIIRHAIMGIVAEIAHPEKPSGTGTADFKDAEVFKPGTGIMPLLGSINS